MNPGDRVRVGGGFSVRPMRVRVGTVTVVDGERVGVTYDDAPGIHTVSRSRVWPLTQTSHRNALTVTPLYNLPEAAEPQPKPVAWRSKKYAAFVRSHPCCSCGATEGVEAAHYGPDSGMSRKASDVYLSAQCHACHAYWHQHGRFPGRSRIQSEALQIEAQRDLLAEWMLRGEDT